MLLHTSKKKIKIVSRTYNSVQSPIPSQAHIIQLHVSIHSIIAQWYLINHIASLSPNLKFDHRQHYSQVVWQSLGMGLPGHATIAGADKTLPLL